MTVAWPPILELPLEVERRPATVDQWVALPEDEPGELVGGVLVEEEVPDAVHELAVSWLVYVLRHWLGRGGFVFGSELKLDLGAGRGRKPDLSVFLGAAAPPRRGPVTRPPEVVVEVVTPTPRDERRDRVEKLDDYASFGVRFYWIVDPALGSVEVFELGADGRYARAAAATAGLMDPVPGCAGLRLDLDALWEELARLAEVE